MHGDDVLSVTFLQWMDRTLYQWRSYSAWTGRCISDVLTKHADDVVSVTCKHKGDILLVTFLQCIGTTFFYPWRSKRIDDVLSVTFLQSMEKISDIQSLETTLNQYRSNNAWRRRFISDVRTVHGQDVVSVTFQHYIDTTFYQWRS